MMLEHVPHEVRVYIDEVMSTRRWNPFKESITLVLVDLGYGLEVFDLKVFKQLSRSHKGIKAKQRYIVYGITAHELGDTLQELEAKISAQRADDWVEQGEPQTWHTPNHTRTWHTQMLTKIICNPLSEEDLKRSMLSWP
jgi:hypothetical protein